MAQNKTNLHFWIFALILLIGGGVEAQEIGVNERGDSIVVYDDGSWRYFDPAVDKDLIKDGAATQVADPTPTPVVERPNPTPTKKTKSKKKKPKTKVKKPKAKASKKTKKTKPPKSKKSKKKKNKGKKKGKKKSKKSKKPKPKKGGKKAKVKKPTEKFTELQESVFREKAIVKAERAARKTASYEMTYNDLVYDRVLLEDDLKEAYTSPNTLDEKIVHIEKKIQAQRAKEEAALLVYEKAQEETDFLNKLIDVSEMKRRKLVAKFEKENPPQINRPTEGEVAAPVILTKNTGASDRPLSKQALKAKQELRKSTNVYLNPPERECPEKSVRFNEFTGKKMVTLDKEIFFTKTPEQMRLLLKDQPYFTCYGALSNTGGLTFLELEIVIASTSAQSAYGLIEKGSKLSLKMINGYTLSLNAFKSVQGEVNNLDKTVTFKPRYLLDKTQIKTLETEPIDQARIIWMTGYDDYEIFDVDFIANQIRCLKAD